ncbi:MAG: hypothetical protein ACRCV3_04315 [Desulfovibrionaceae bacterium]
METLLADLSQYASKQDVLKSIDDDITMPSVQNYSSRENVLGETSRDRFERLLLEMREDGIQYPNVIERGTHIPEDIYSRENAFFTGTPKVSVIDNVQINTKYVAPSQNTNLVTRSHILSNEIENRYTLHSLKETKIDIHRGNGINHTTHWNQFKTVNVPSTVSSPHSGDTILRNLGIIPKEAIDTPLEIQQAHSETPSERILRTMQENIEAEESINISPINLIAIQAKASAAALAAGLNNKMYTTTEQNLTQLTKGGE